jgi:PEP-CTERM motif
MRSLVFGGIVASMLAGAVPASAAVSTIDLSFTGTGISGSLDLTYVSGTSPFTVDGVTGSVDVGGTTYTVTGLTTYAGDDQKFYSPSSSSVAYVDFPGISVSLSDGDALNLFSFDPTSYGALLRSQNASGDPYTGAYYAVAVTDPSSAPEPSTWAMMLLGFAGLGFVATRRRRTPIAALG